MGWSFNYFGDKKYLVSQLRDPSRFTAGTKLLQACTVGNHHWYLAETNGRKWIGLDLMQGGGKNSGWGYKSMDESAGPYYFDCPVSYLDKADVAPGPHAAAWREKVRQFHADKKNVFVPAVGKTFPIKGELFTIGRKDPFRRGWLVVSPSGATYYCSTENIRRWVKAAEMVDA